jgi:hypothetical protein
MNKKIFPEDFFDLPNKQDFSFDPKNRAKQKDHPKLINPSSTLNIRPSGINEIKEEDIEESEEHIQIKRNSLKIIIPDKSNDELEPSTRGSSNVKISPNNPSRLIFTEKKKYDLYPKYKSTSNKKNKNEQLKEEEKYKITAHFTNEQNSKYSSKDKNWIKRPSTPIINRYKNIYNPSPFTCNNKNTDKYKFNYNFETNKNGVIIPKGNKKIQTIQRKNLFNVGHTNNNNKEKKNNNNSKTNINSASSRVEQIFGTQGSSPKNASLVSLKNNLNQKIINKAKDGIKINNFKKTKNYSFIENQNFENKTKKLKMFRAKSAKNKYVIESSFRNKKDNGFNKNNNKNQIEREFNKERKKINSYNKKKFIPHIPVKHISNVQNQLETEMNNLFKILPEDFDKYPEIKNNFEIIVKKINGIKEYIYKNTQNNFRKKKNNINMEQEQEVIN